MGLILGDGLRVMPRFWAVGPMSRTVRTAFTPPRGSSAQRPPHRGKVSAGVAIACLVLLLPAAFASTPSSSVVRATFSAPFTGVTVNAVAYNSTSGCASIANRALPEFNATTGTGFQSGSVQARSCLGSMSSAVDIAPGVAIYFPLNSSLGKAGFHIRLSFHTTGSWAISPGHCVDVGGSAGTCAAFAEVQDFTWVELFDLTTGRFHTGTIVDPLRSNSSMAFSASCSLGSCPGWPTSATNGSIVGGNDRLTLSIGGTLLASDSYALLLSVVAVVQVSFQSAGSAHISGATGFANANVSYSVGLITVT